MTVGIAVLIAAHGYGGGAGLIHPLTGVDHTVAMLAVGAWSAVLGRKALWLVPSAFVAAMVVGATAALAGARVPGVEVAIACSVVLLGAAIACRIRVTAIAATTAVFGFGASHGMAHGVEFLDGERVTYVVGVVITTACLHAIGAVAALLLTDLRHGLAIQRILGSITAMSGVGLILTGL